VGFNTRIVPGPAELAEAAAAWTAERIASAVGVRGACYLALAGGETPRGCYERLAQPPHRDALPWPSLFVYWSDERQVPLDDPSSNYAMAKAALLDHVPIPPTQVFPLVGDPTPALRRIPADARGRPRFDLIHLGLGEDGHTASLFPGSPVLDEAEAPVAEHGVLNHAEVGGDGAAPAPSDRVHQQSLSDPSRPPAAFAWQRRRELSHRALEGRTGRRGEERLDLGRCEAREVGAPTRQQLDAAVGPGIGVDRHPGRAQGVDVSVHRPFRNLQALGQLARREAAASLEQ